LYQISAATLTYDYQEHWHLMISYRVLRPRTVANEIHPNSRFASVQETTPTMGACRY